MRAACLPASGLEPLPSAVQEHWINPVLYAEFENINSADKALLEVVGHDGIDDFLAEMIGARRNGKSN